VCNPSVISSSTLDSASGVSANLIAAGMSLPSRLFVATRPWSFTASLAGMMVSSALAYNSSPSSFSWTVLLLTFLGGLCFHCCANLVNTYFDFRYGLDKRETSDDRTLFDLALQPRHVLALILFFLVGSVVCCAWLLALAYHPAVLYLIAAGGLAGVFYTAGPLRLKYRGLGDITIFLCFGPLLCAGTFVLQAQRSSLVNLGFSLPLGLRVEAILHVNNARDVTVDRKAGALTLPQLLGPQATYLFYCGLFIFAVASLVLLALLLHTSYWLLLPLLSLPLLPALFAHFRNKRWEAAMGGTAGYAFLFGALLTIGVLLSGVQA
jgi:1,4-dihydroxy-2-naphthoate octaprenyltransferase